MPEQGKHRCFRRFRRDPYSVAQPAAKGFGNPTGNAGENRVFEQFLQFGPTYRRNQNLRRIGGIDQDIVDRDAVP